ncbi:hypothetical protein RS3R2_11900 [Pseudomonas lactis]|nr:hypothetical protein RS3R2_11900 [Pseudomonas lactis]
MDVHGLDVAGVAGQTAVYRKSGAGGIGALIHKSWNAIKCGSWLACDADTSVYQMHRGDAIAGKPAPTG